MGDRLRSDHSYRLYSSLVSINPQLKDFDWQLNTITGIPDSEGWIKLGRKSILMVRCPFDRLKIFDAFDNGVIKIGQNIIQLGKSEGNSVQPKPSLSSRLTTIKSL
jgi:CRISPR-associated protein Cas6